METTMPWRSGDPPQEGLASEAWLVLESKRKGLRSKRTPWGPQEDPRTSLSVQPFIQWMREGGTLGWSLAPSFILDKIRSQRTLSLGSVKLRTTAMSGVGHGA